MFNVSMSPASTIRSYAGIFMLLIFSVLVKNESLLAQSEKVDSVRNLSEVVIQTTRVNDKSPVPHSVISAEKIVAQSHAQDVPYLLSSLPSLVESSDAGTGIGYTGLRIRGSDPTRINVTLNGIPLNDAESQIMYWVDLPDLAAGAAEIQVQRGVGSSTNGAGAFGATVNVDLSKVEPEPFAVLSGTVGAFGTLKQSVQLGTGLLKQRVAFSARLSDVRSEGYVDRADVRLRSMHLNATYVDDIQSFQVHFLSGHERTYQAWDGLPAQYLDIDSLRRYNNAGTEQPVQPYKDQVDDYTQRHLLAHYKRRLSENLFLQLSGHYTRGFGYYEQYKADQQLPDYQLPLGSLPDTLPTDLIRQLWLDNDFYGGNFALRWQPDAAWKPQILLGGALSRYTGSHFGKIIWAELYTGASKDYQYYRNEASKNDGNVYLKMEANPFSRFTAFADLQLRWIQYDFLGFDANLDNVKQSAPLKFFNPKLGLTYSISNNWNAYAYIGTGHREPNRDDYTQSTPESRPRSEQMLDGETGLKRSGQTWSAAANFYWMQYKDQLVLDGRINDVGAYIRTNVPDSYRAGVELEGAYRPVSFFNLEGNATFSRNKVKQFTEYRDNWDSGEQEAIRYNNADLAFSPKLTAYGAANFSFNPGIPAAQMGVTLSGKYVSAQFLDNTSNPLSQLPAYWVSDLRIRLTLKRFIGKETTLLCSANNLFNRHYVSNGWVYRYVSTSYDPRPDDPYTVLEGNSVYHQAGYFPQAGRHWMCTLRIAL